ncbi:cbb3-type cytochrome oxidase assembly protein CcoS [Pedobacter sp. KR3-3]|uniref:Cbb3-type cytochrome oxidase assembly protein CcoS n=1 Tax=Pedobacter albus TaxID=3113905 RepID=A0ABU7I5D1_9SPHI|nr:cbb3-type cytochrome oxidase assembly protein CcoS [Pedobacter sp. KR3-3]MEE1944572.1 cbb3-type cytochrome oxidase assembly protein CcoS [Pedobacter sp. KR3-3]
MNILYFLIGCSVLMALVFLGAFFWAMKDGQHNDVHTPGIRVLFDDEPPDAAEDPQSPKQNEKTDQNHF